MSIGWSRSPERSGVLVLTSEYVLDPAFTFFLRMGSPQNLNRWLGVDDWVTDLREIRVEVGAVRPGGSQHAPAMEGKEFRLRYDPLWLPVHVHR